MKVSMQYSGHKITPSFIDSYKCTHWGGEDCEGVAHMESNPLLPCILSDVKLLCLGCRNSACRLRRESALLVFYSSLLHKIQYIVKASI
jgi:hypothetical protein